jgi:predicted short-subunit dehydrogenase-like oxidoreductase (DUF2520 family)
MTDNHLSLPRCAVIGRGRLGTALASALLAAGLRVDGPLGRGESPADDADVILLAVPDGEIERAAAAVPARPGRLVGHCSGATTLAPLAPHEAFSLHPLMTVTAEGADFRGATAAVAGSTPRALDAATRVALAAGLRPVEVSDDDRAAYHAAASIASNFLVTLEGAAERLAATAGVDRAALAPLVRAGPIARGDEATVRRQRAALEHRAPELVALFDALAAATRELAARPAKREADRPDREADRPATGEAERSDRAHVEVLA